jgi:UDP-glucose 4-epimerase
MALIEAGWRVVVIDDLSTGLLSAVHRDAQFYQLDCADPRLGGILKSENAVAAIHFAARISVEESAREPALYYETDTFKAAHFFQSAIAAGVESILFSSTAAVYGQVGAEPVDETAPTRPESPYGRAKLAAEWILRDLCAASGTRSAILRYFNVAGADARGRSGPPATATHLIKKTCDAALGRSERLVINGDDYDTPDGTCIRDYIHVTDLADAHVLVMRHLLQGGEDLLLNCGYGQGFSVREIIDAAVRVTGAPIPTEVGPRRPGDPVSVVADSTRLRAALGWRPTHADIDEIIASALVWESRREAAADLVPTA